MKSRMSTPLFALFLLLLVNAPAALATEVFMPRYPAVSPDGQVVVFSFQGDLWRVPATEIYAQRWAMLCRTRSDAINNMRI